MWCLAMHVGILFCHFLSRISWLIIRGVPSLIIAQTQVSAPLNSQPVNGYRKGGVTPKWSPAWSST